jgi:hypothetical protein
MLINISRVFWAEIFMLILNFASRKIKGPKIVNSYLKSKAEDLCYLISSYRNEGRVVFVSE